MVQKEKGKERRGKGLTGQNCEEATKYKICAFNICIKNVKLKGEGEGEDLTACRVWGNTRGDNYIGHVCIERSRARGGWIPGKYLYRK